MASSLSGRIITGLKPPPGVTPNFVNPYNESKYTATIVASLLPVATIFVWIRLYTKVCLIKSHGWDDYTSFIAWLGLIAYSALKVKSKESGSGVHQWDLPVQRLKGWALWTNITAMVYEPTISITKLSILLMYLRIFMPNRSIRTRTYYLTQFIIWFNVLFYLAILIVTGCQCVPRRKIWNPWVPGKCVNPHALLAVTAVINLLLDFSILLLPIQSIWHLQLSPKRKLAISSVFATGLVGYVASIMRVVVSVKTYHSQDFTYTLSFTGHWSYAEVVIGIVCGCAPVLPKFFRHVIPRFTQTLSCHRSKVRNFFGRISSQPTPSPSCGESSTTLPRDSGGDTAVTQEKKNGKWFRTLRSFGNNGKGSTTMTHAELPRTSTSTSIFHEKDSETDGSQDLESQQGITKTTRVETSISSRTELQEKNIFHL
ncbi:hypothetical protein MMC22_003510 [Lobaria immixta]|nr:hypothetical protein [Lobaria immixta]